MWFHNKSEFSLLSFKKNYYSQYSPLARAWLFSNIGFQHEYEWKLSSVIHVVSIKLSRNGPPLIVIHVSLVTVTIEQLCQTIAGMKALNSWKTSMSVDV